MAQTHKYRTLKGGGPAAFKHTYSSANPKLKYLPLIKTLTHLNIYGHALLTQSSEGFGMCGCVCV